jgi:hypothetical protein
LASTHALGSGDCNSSARIAVIANYCSLCNKACGLRQQLGQLTLDDPKVGALRTQAEAALAAADFPHAEDKLHEAAAIELSAASAITKRAHARATTAAGCSRKARTLQR